MRKRSIVAGMLFAVVVVSFVGVMAKEKAGTRVVVSSRQAAAEAVEHGALVSKYCVTCHSERGKAGGLTLAALDVAKPGEHGDVWEKVIRKVRGGLMPPAGQPRPDQAALQGFAAYLERELDRESERNPNPGRTDALHRLNRTEYRNAIKDLLDVDVDVSALLPADDASYGFDNIAGVLRMDQSRLEQYLSAALKVSRAAIGTTPPVPNTSTFIVNNELPQYDRDEELPFGTRGGTLVRHVFPYDAEYVIKVELKCPTDIDLKCDSSGGFSEPHTLEISLDGTPVHVYMIEPREQRDGYIEERDELPMFRVPVKAGPHELAVTFVKSLSSFEFVGHGYRKRFQKPYRYEYGPRVQKVYVPFVERVSINGPWNPAGPGDTPSRRRILICRPATAADETPCARAILSNLARRAFRRPITDAETRDLLSFYEVRRKEGGTFDEGIETGLQRLLVSTNFLFRVEREPASTSTAKSAAGTGMYRISDLELASRLSFFIWSSIPDDELLRVATNDRLKDPVVLERQVRRMLRDKRATALINNFVGQWLEVRNLEAKRPSEALFPDFDETLRRSMRRETELFLASIVREDRSVIDMLNADYTYLNERLAQHYGIPHVKGSHFRRVSYPPGSPRRGLLGHGSILTVTSQPARTSPVIRGKWLLSNVLGTPPPDPPANVPPLMEPEEGTRKQVLSVRERMAKHRANVVCATCHSMIDPLGFALEQFDATGRYREVDEAFKPVDTSAVLPDGTKVNGVNELRGVLLRHPDRFITTLVTRMLTYALGRGVEYYDMPAVRAIVRGAAQDDYRFSAIVLGLVRSLPFQMRKVASAQVQRGL